MSRRNFVKEEEYGLALGMDSTSPLPSIPAGFVREALNANLGLEGGYIKRDGIAAQLSSAWGTRNITGGIEYTDAAGTQKKIVFGTDGTGSGGRIGYYDNGSITEIETGLDGTVRPCFVQHGSLLFFINGSDEPKVYDGTAVRQMGITAPASAPTIALGAGGSLNTNANYIWAYTYYNSTTGAESSPSALSATTDTGANTKATLSISAGDSDTADRIRIYRTVANGNELFLVDDCDIADTSYVDTTADTALTTAMELDNSRLVDLAPEANYPIVIDNRIFVVMRTGEVGWSKKGQSGAMAESFEAKAVADTTGTFGANDKEVGIGAAGSIPIVLKQSSIGRLEQIGLPNNQLSSDNVSYEYKELSSIVGAVSHHAAVPVFDELVFLSRDNIYATNGASIRPVANPIQATIKALSYTSSQITKVSSINDTKLRQVKFAVFTSSAATKPTYILVGDYQKYPTFRWTLYRPGTNTNTHPGIKAGCFFHVTNSSDGTQDVWMGNIDGNGQVYKMNSGTTDAGSDIYYKIVTRPYAHGSPLADKLFKDAVIHAQGNGNSYNLTVSAIYDLSDEEEAFYTLSLSNQGSLWDNSVWDTATWGSARVGGREYPAHRKAKYQQLVFKQTSGSAPVTLFGWASTASIFRVY